MSTPSDKCDVDFLETLGVAAFKVGSDDCTNYPFLSYIAKKGLPIILSTGLCNLEEVKAAISAVWQADNKDLIILQCTTSYPSDVRYANLRAMLTMRDSLQVQVGYSDHTSGNNAAIAAVALGATVIEKHFTYDKHASGPDHCFSADAVELKAMVKAIRDVGQALGSPFKQPTETEKENLMLFRKSVVATQNIPAGTVITEALVTAKRPGIGIPAKDIGLVIGRIARKFIEQDDVITWEDI